MFSALKLLDSIIIKVFALKHSHCSVEFIYGSTALLHSLCLPIILYHPAWMLIASIYTADLLLKFILYYLNALWINALPGI